MKISAALTVIILLKSIITGIATKETSFFPSILPEKAITAYVNPTVKRIKLSGDYLKHLDVTLPTLSSLKDNIKTILPGNDLLVNEITALENLLIEVMTGVKAIITWIKSLREEEEYQGTQIKDLPEIKSINLLPVVTRTREFTNELMQLKAAVKTPRGRRAIAPIRFQTFPSITMRGIPLGAHTTVGCSLTSKNASPKYKVSCLLRYIKIVKQPAWLYIGSDLLVTILRYSRYRNNPIVKQISTLCKLLGLEENLSLIRFRSQVFYRLMRGPSQQVIEVYNEFKIPTLYTEEDREVIFGDILEEEPMEDTTTTVEEDITTQPLPVNEDITTKPDEEVIVTNKPQENSWIGWRDGTKYDDEEEDEIKITEEEKEPEIQEISGNPSLEELTRKLTLAWSPTTTQPEPDYMADTTGIPETKETAKPTAKPTAGDDTAKPTAKSAGDDTDKKLIETAKLTLIAVNANTQLIIQNFLKTMSEQHSTMKHEIIELIQLTKYQNLDLLTKHYIPSERITMEHLVYDTNTGDVTMIVNHYEQPRQLFEYKHLELCGYASCISIMCSNMIGSDQLDFKGSYNAEDCTVNKEKTNTYFCKKNTRKEECLFVELSCPYQIKSLTYRAAQVYASKYLVLTTPLNGSLLNNKTHLPGNSIIMITVQEDAKLVIEGKTYTLTGINQVLPMTIHKLQLTRDEIDVLGKFAQLRAVKELTHRYLNTVGIVIVGLTGAIMWGSMCYYVKRNPRQKQRASNEAKSRRNNETDELLQRKLNLKPMRQTDRVERADD